MPGVAAEFDLDSEELEDKLDEIVGKWPEHRRAILTALAEDLVGEIKRDIPTNSSRAKGTVRAQRSGDQVYVVAGGENGVDYIEPLLEGSEPHAPGPPNKEDNPSLARWARRNNYPGGFESIYWSIYHYGTEPHDFVSEPLDRTRGNVENIAEQVLNNRGVFE